MKPLLIGGVALVLAGCVGNLGEMTQSLINPAPEPEMAIPRVNRAAIEAADLAAVLMLSPEAKIATVGVAIQMREGRINYSSNENRGVTLDGGLLYATLGLGTNLLAVEAGGNDPLVSEARAEDWPAQVERTYYLPQRGLAPEVMTASCRVIIGEGSREEIVGVTRTVTQVVEDCTNDDGTRFANVHALDARTGRVWRTSQWTGPDQGNVQIDVIDQFDPSS